MEEIIKNELIQEYKHNNYLLNISLRILEIILKNEQLTTFLTTYTNMSWYIINIINFHYTQGSVIPLAQIIININRSPMLDAFRCSTAKYPSFLDKQLTLVYWKEVNIQYINYLNTIKEQ